MRTITQFDTEAREVPTGEIFAAASGQLHVRLRAYHRAGDILTVHDYEGAQHTIALGLDAGDGLWMAAPSLPGWHMGTCEVCGRHTGVHTETNLSGIAVTTCGRHLDLDIY